MCGFCGIYTQERLNTRDLNDLHNMNNALIHRGPDDEGYVLINAAGKALALKGQDTIPELEHMPVIGDASNPDYYGLCMGHRRLSIIDVTARGHQPMVDPQTGSWIAYNGEIYNYLEIKSQLSAKGHKFQTDTDTEVILKSYLQWGPDCLHHFNGMWAFAVWDNQKKRLFCSRDRFGVKPFYYLNDGKQFVFSSEIKSILKHSNIAARGNSKIIWDYLALTLIDHTEETFFEKIMQLLPGHFLIVDLEGKLTIHQYYTLTYYDGIGQYNDDELRHLSKEFADIFDNAVKIRLRSDVPVGSYLSGGLDSSSILGIVDRYLDQLPYDFKTFSAVYSGPNFDESEFIEAAIGKKKVKPCLYHQQQERLLEDLDQLIYHQEEPFISTAIYAQWSLLKNIKDHAMKVILTGDGADEILSGYPYPNIALFLLGLLKERRFPEYYRELRANGYKNGLTHTLKGIYWLFPSFLRIPIRKNFRLKPKIMKKDFFHEFLWREKVWMDVLFRSSLQERLHLDMTRFLVPHELRFRDKNAMAFSVEERQPFLDYRLVEFCFNTPGIYKIFNGWRKYLLRVSTDEILPPEIQWRKTKLGFGTNELRWYLQMPKLENLRCSDYVNPQKFSSVSQHFSSNSPDKTTELWSFYNLELWMREFEIT